MNDKYIPLYRKYRPQKLEELVGQEHIKNALKNAVELNKISHAYLFTGPRGTGKTSTARIFAKSLNCKNGPTINPCGVCESCIDIANSVPIDVIEIDAASNRKVEDTQNILEKILYAPVYGKYKIYIIDEVHMLSNTAFNSLLKTLEEPPENVIFILATTEVHKVLDTIKSRCQRFDFRRITTDDIVKHLRYISEKENINITDDALFTIAKNSAGGMRDSIALLDQLSILGGKNAIETEDINRLLGRISFDVLCKLSDAILTSNPQGALEMFEDIYNAGNEPVQILTNLLDYLKNLLIVKSCSEDIIFELTQLNEVQITALKDQTKCIETHQIMSLIDKCSDYIKEIKLTNNPRLWLEVSIIDLANLTENTTLEALQKRLSQLEAGNTARTVYKTPPSPVAKPEMISKSETKNELQSSIQAVRLENASAASEIIKSHEEQTVKQDELPEKFENSSEIQIVEDFTPMPRAHIVDKSKDIAVLWAELLNNISSPPTKSLLKQWANPVELSPEKVVISINSENLLKQFGEGNKRKVLSEAVKSMFKRDDTNIIVRLPQSGDLVVSDLPPVSKSKPELPPQPDVIDSPDESLSTEEDLEDIRGESVVNENNPAASGVPSMHSDMANMVVDVFDGKFLD